MIQSQMLLGFTLLSLILIWHISYSLYDTYIVHPRKLKSQMKNGINVDRISRRLIFAKMRERVTIIVGLSSYAIISYVYNTAQVETTHEFIAVNGFIASSTVSLIVSALCERKKAEVEFETVNRI